MVTDDQNWKAWSEMCLRELSQLRIDIDTQRADHREDIIRIADQISALNDKFMTLTKSQEDSLRDADKKQEIMLIQLKTKAEEAGKAAGEFAVNNIGSGLKTDAAKYGVIITAILVGLAEFIKIYLLKM